VHCGAGVRRILKDVCRYAREVGRRVGPVQARGDYARCVKVGVGVE
jgi:hypothetical protein